MLDDHHLQKYQIQLIDTTLLYFAICPTDQIPHPNTEKRTTDCTSQVSIAFCPSLSLSATAFGIMRCSSCSLLCRSSSSFRKFSSSVFPLSNNFDLKKKKERKKFSSIYVSRYGMKAIKAAWQIQTISWRVFIRRGVITTLKHQVQFCRSVPTYVIVSYMNTFLSFSFFFFRSLVGNSLELIRLSSPFRRSLPLIKFARRCDIDLLNILC